MKKKISLKWKIGRYLILFAVVLIALLFLFQIVLLEPMYESSKLSSVKYAGEEIASAIDEDTLEDIVFNSSVQNDTCIVLNYKDATMAMKNQQCTAFSQMSQERINDLIQKAAGSKNNTYISISHNVSMISRNWWTLASNDFKNIIYTRIVEGKSGKGVLMIYSGISPVSATTKTLKKQLSYLSIGILIAVIGLTFVIYRGIEKPLSKINEAAKGLGSGKYEVDPSTNKYKEAEELNTTLSNAAKDIQKADKAKRDLLANVSHDLRTPLTMISGYGEMMKELPGEKTDENLQVIIDESKRLNQLVNDLLDLSRFQDNRITLEKTSFDITQMIQEELRKYDVYMYQDGYKIEVQLDRSAIVYADKKRMQQVFNNFMTNAINYSGNNKHIIVKEEIHEDTVTISVQDFGEGMAEDKLHDIWDRYYKIDKEHVRVSSGSGIGLAIVKQILDLHNLKYGVKSKVKEGSTFYFEMPIQKNI